MRKNFLYINFCLLLNATLFSQSFVFEKVYDWSTADYIVDLIPTDDNGYAFVGTSENQSFVMKLDSNGDSLWTYIIDPSGSAWGSQIIQSNNSNLIIANQIDGDALLLELSLSGDSISSIIYPFSIDGNRFISVLEQNNGDFVVTERTEQNGGNAPPLVFFHCFSSDGILKWSQNLGDNYPFSVILTNEDEILTTGINNWWDMKIWVAKFDSMGNYIYSNNLDGGEGKQIIESSSGELYVSVDGYSSNGGIYNAMRLNSNGTQSWKLYNNNGLDGRSSTICQISPNRFAIGGYQIDALAIKVFSSTGDSLSFFTYDKYYFQYASKIFKVDECLAVGGNIKDTNNNRSILIFKILLDSLYMSSNPVNHSKNQSRPIIYPNPVHNSLKIDVNNCIEKFAKFELYSMEGELLKTQKIKSNKTNHIKMQEIRNGLYVIKLIAEDKIYLEKLIKR